ncbi:MAG: MFS transporter [Firmicutes bacterium]|mgnify:CR=1 FL=1|nr:MFS transporter [Bacillota bacterium]
MIKNHENNPEIALQAKPPLWSLNFIIVCLSNLNLFLVFNGLNATLPVYIEKFGGTTKIAGLAMTSLTVAAIMARPTTGWALGKYGRRKLLVCGLVLFLIPSIIYIRMIPVASLIALRFLQGLGWGISHTAISTVALDVIPQERMGEGLGFYSLFSSLSLALSPAIALWLVSQYTFDRLFIICTLLTLCTLIVSSFIRYPKVEMQASDHKLELLKIADMWPSIVIFFMVFANSSTISFLALYTIDLGLTEKAAGLFFTTMALTTLITRPLSGTIVDRIGQKGFDFCVMIGAVAIFIAVFFLVYTFQPVHLLIAGLLYGLCSGFFQAIMLVLAVRIVPPGKKSIANAIYWTAVDTGVALGSFSWGFVAYALGFKPMYGFTLIPVTVAILIYTMNRRKTKEKIETA